MRTITAWLIRKRDDAASAWLGWQDVTRRHPRGPYAHNFRAEAARWRRRLARWDRALDLWTRGGTRRT